MSSLSSHNPDPTRGWRWCWLACWLWCQLAQGQQIVLELKSGDCLTGHVLSENTNGVFLATAFSDSLFIPGPLIARRETLAVSSSKSLSPEKGQAPALSSG